MARPRFSPLAAGLVLIAVFSVVAAAAPWITRAPEDGASLLGLSAERTDLDALFQPPSAAHPLGTDGLGRDVLARTLHGARVSLGIGLLSAALALFVGVPLGAAAGFFGGIVDRAVSRTLEALLCLPALLLVLVLAHSPPPGIRDLPDALRLAIVLGLTGWMTAARYLRAEVLKLKRRSWVLAARSAGVPSARILTRHLLPAALTSVAVTAAFGVGAAIGLEAALSFLGLGISPPTPSWGEQLAEARVHLSRAGWLAWPPGVALFLVVLGCHWIGEGLRDRLDPEGDKSVLLRP